MRAFHLPVLVLGIVLALGIFYLVRRDHLYIRQGLFWVVIAIASLVLGMWPGLIDLLSAGAGIAYPPALLFLVAIVVLVIKALFGDIELTKLRRDVRRLNQRIALIESGQLPDVQAREELPRVTEPGERERS